MDVGLSAAAVGMTIFTGSVPKTMAGGNWIAGATRNKGALHRALGVPADEKIPAAKLDKAAKSKNPTMRKRAALAKTLKAMHHCGPRMHD